ncbi:flagellar biosynthesis protein FlhB [Desulfobotulus sp.]|jgi:flagellar biosynthetic protein FlhB|uniref:flagellar biosynthesis protein FlhB n=1 Tax=Desulfobotulus sp. TaxID=1940337 RepID=UPI002A36FB4E|nr:flagellar biosynthesis protein FlhB [Desulfobotulus sp.]MDY0164027.1 flagellar biosynthesis protein FlhB [Desulfobotulus sp.]
MPEDSGQEKTEDATPKKRQQSREEGQVGKSVEVPSVLVLLASVTTLYALSGFLYQRMTGVLYSSLHFSKIPEVHVEQALFWMKTYFWQSFWMLAPLLLVVFLAAFLSNAFQVGFVIAWKAIEPKPSKIDPIKGLGRIFSKKSLMEFFKSILKITIIFYVSWRAVKADVPNMMRLYDHDVAVILLFMVKLSFKIFLWVLLAMVFVALLDLIFQRWNFDQEIKMTKQEVKDESKQTEGDPQIKSRIRQLQFEASKKRMMQDVPKADVVVTNPTHIAVALKYDALNMQAPQVLAKGAGSMAERIKAVAREAGVPIVENKPLARNLFQMVDVGQSIPGDLYQAVAEVLAYVYKLKGRH